MGPQPPEHVEGSRELLQQALGESYLIERELGRGGMATVYLARDLRHRRAVAVKVLHPELSAALGPERFLREIELTASLQHPHILPLFDSGAASGLLYYVMPFVEGETLRVRLEREQQLPVADAVRIATEVADALHYAHGLGVIHRDIKPENVLLQGGHAFVADFGIALAVQQASGTRMTQTGLSLGTPHYMAPEQAMGERVVTLRADVYALGATTYEMLAGEPPFSGPTAQAVLARAMTDDPRSLMLQRPSVPAHVDLAVRTALAKVPADRFSSAAEFAAALSGAGTTSGFAPVRASARRGARARTRALLGGALLATTAIGWLLGRRTADRSNERGTVRFSIELDSNVRRFGDLAVSPDGRIVAYAADGAAGTQLYARRLSDVAARPLPFTENAEAPFFSPDGAWVAFYSNGALRKVRVDSGPSVLVTRLPPEAWFAGGTWGSDGTIHFATTPRGELFRVPSSGGTPSPVAVSDRTVRLVAPRSLPGARALLVTASPDLTAGRIGVLDLESGRLRQFGSGLGARYVDGRLIYAGLRGELFSQPFDLDRLEPTGEAAQLASGLDAVIPNGRFAFDATAGAVVYHLGAGESANNGKLTLTDSAGGTPRVLPGRTPWAPRFSPDGRRIAYGAYAPGRDSSDIWIADLESGTAQRLTTDGDDNNDPVWSPDGRRIAYDKNAEGGKDVFLQSLDGGSARVLTRRPGFQWPTDWARDGRTVLFTDVTAAGQYDLWVQPSDAGEARPYLTLPARETGARLSPDGRWVAYQSDETGRYEVYVQSYPTTGRKTLISLGGGVNPVWRADGRMLYYWRVDELLAARLDSGGSEGSLIVRSRTPLFRAPYVESALPMYDVSPDGTRFVIVMGEAQVSRLVVALGALDAHERGRNAAR